MRTITLCFDKANRTYVCRAFCGVIVRMKIHTLIKRQGRLKKKFQTASARHAHDDALF